jgi:hypothetical protein
MTSWRKGDLGRFEAENADFPRFEVINATREGVTVWYGGSAKTQVIPLEVFKKECVKWWRVKVPLVSSQDWIKPKVRFSLRDVEVVQAREPSTQGKTNWHGFVASVRLSGEQLVIRNIRNDYASCDMTSQGILVLVPIHTIVKYGVQIITVWDRLISDEDPFEPEFDPFAELR